MLCQICSKIFQGRFHPRFPRRSHHQRFADLRRAARDGCWICDKLWKDLFEFYWTYYQASEAVTEEEKAMIMLKDISQIRAVANPRRTDPGVTSNSDSDITYSLDMESESPDIELHFMFTDLTLGTERDGQSAVKDAPPAFFILTIKNETAQVPQFDLLNLKESQTFPFYLAKSWLEDCLRTHQECSLAESEWYPTRLLELDAPRPGMIRLIHTLERELKNPYMTLSHCWGKAEFLKLTAQSNFALSEGIEASSLPQTFQDAIKVALQFGTKYLWIDSLCIFQDSSEDWIYESSVMGNIYRNGICNLAATGSGDSHGGLFSNRPSLNQILKNPCYVKSSWTDATNDYWHVHPYFHKMAHFLNGPLLNRGWVVQERIMATRILHFGAEQMYWECYHHDVCETYPSGLPRFRPGSPELIAFKRKYKPLHIASDPLEMMGFWAAIVSTFSQCGLTMEEDKIVALSGVAKAMQSSSLECQYLAGLWRFGLEKSLLWYVQDTKQWNGKPSIRCKQYRAPSWSWASIDAHIKYAPESYYSSQPSRIEILEATTEALGADPTGQVKNGHLKLLGPLMTTSFRGTVERKDYAVEFEMKVNGKWQRCYPYNPDIDEPSHDLHCMPVQSTDLEPNTSFDCLLLQPTSNVETGIFTRWGIANIDTEKFNIQQWKNIQNEEWFQFQEHDGNGKYTVTII